MQGDVYPVEPYESFHSDQVLDAHWGVLYDEDVRTYVILKYFHYCYEETLCESFTCFGDAFLKGYKTFR